MKVVFDHSKLLGKMKEMSITQGELASMVGIAENTMSAKINGESYFRTDEIKRICIVLNIKDSDVGAYFFVPKV